MQQVSIGALKSPSPEDITRLSTLSVVSSHLCSVSDTPSLLKSILESLVSAFGADRGFINLYQDGEFLEGCSLDISESAKWQPFTFTQTLLDTCLTAQEPVLVIDTKQVAPTQSVTMTGIRSVMLCPLLSDSRLIGVIYLDSLVRAGCFEENDLHLFTLISDMVAIACDRNLHLDTVKRQAVALDDAQEQLHLAAEETIRRLSRAAEFRDGETSEHLTRVSEYCEAVSRHMGLEESMVRDIKIASMLHDVGKLGIPDSIMLKPGRFTDYERRVMQQHTQFGARILANSTSPVIELAALVALRHHEKWDGSGYPDGLSGEDIPLPARIVAAADVFDAVSSARRYKESYSLQDTFELLRKESGSHFDPQVAKAFLDIKDEIEAIWNENQDLPDEESPAETEDSEEEKSAALGKVQKPLTVKQALEVVESSPTVLARNSGFDAEFRQKLKSGLHCLAGTIQEKDRPVLDTVKDLVSKENVSFQDATKLAQLVQEVRGIVPVGKDDDSALTRILVLDSDPYQREVLSTEATRRGMKVYECSEPEAALRLAEEKSPHLIILEIDDNGGEEFLQTVKEAHPELPVLVLSRNGTLSRRLLVSGHPDCSFLHKPLPSAAVLDEVEEHLPQGDRQSKLTVVAFDDDKVVLTVIARVLEKQGYKVYAVSEPIEFWNVLTEHTPDLLLLDLEMPSVTGFEICRVLRNDAEFRHLPVVVLTAHQDVSEYQKALEAGADDVLSKPLQARRLLSRIETRLARNRALKISGNRDPLTGLMHRRQAIRTAEQLFASALRQRLSFAVCILEIENFEDMVERNGWQASADVLRQTAEVLVRSNRPEDVVTRSKDHKLLLMLSGVDSSATEQRVASLNTKLSQHTGALGSVKCSASHASSPKDGTDLKSLLEKVGFEYSSNY